jgi:hypothetical protein
MPRNWGAFVFALVSGALAALAFADRGSQYGGWYHRYVWLAWAISAVVWAYRAYRADPEA